MTDWTDQEITEWNRQCDEFLKRNRELNRQRFRAFLRQVLALAGIAALSAWLTWRLS